MRQSLHILCVYLSQYIHCVLCVFECVQYHLHWVCEHHAIKANEVLVVQGVHNVDLTDEVLQSVGLTEYISLQTFYSYVQLENKRKNKLLFDPSQHIFIFLIVKAFLMMFTQMHPNNSSVGILTTFPVAVSHSPLFTTPNEPSPSFSNSVRSFSGMRQVRACCCPSRGAPPPGCVARTASPRDSGGVGDSLRKEEAGWPCWGKSPPSGRLPLKTYI